MCEMLGYRYTIAVKGQERSDTVKSKGLFLVEVKSQGLNFYLQHAHSSG